MPRRRKRIPDRELYDFLTELISKAKRRWRGTPRAERRGMGDAFDVAVTHGICNEMRDIARRLGPEVERHWAVLFGD